MLDKTKKSSKARFFCFQAVNSGLTHIFRRTQGIGMQPVLHQRVNQRHVQDYERGIPHRVTHMLINPLVLKRGCICQTVQQIVNHCTAIRYMQFLHHPFLQGRYNRLPHRRKYLHCQTGRQKFLAHQNCRYPETQTSTSNWKLELHQAPPALC